MGAWGRPKGAPAGFGVRFRIALAGRALRVSIRKFPLENEMTGFEMIGRVPLQFCFLTGMVLMPSAFCVTPWRFFVIFCIGGV